ncbi:hypothetical protein GUITHDRAFT_121207 [Guillardia theta CCMP2712]|uniref:Uncharacterized protein n=1 Tax=Guillardia theta (strain CCMP2712) TaxID=905079 RepID=L1I8M0_GUITC|nr:hypothetical protein GUITHDRAFT_121207 [Guillardia theta CCMP2712]EKX32616.1 hypothetical protein GUITHDRAFT_121207 [Guillardia theta CCMP2712]|eukprot:XP_005819596.1 hypothetical protein GUITHDRAFT_121207 [Guillardia theta CCMP2712]
MSNDIARVWLQGDGQHCDSNTPGAGAIKRASKRVGDGNFWYKPEMASRVREFYKSCSARCAKGDSTLDSMYCQVRNPMALSFLQQGGSQVVCDDISPGRSAVSRCPDGMYNGLCDGSVYRYRRRRGEEVEAWYTSCMQQPSGGGRQGQRVSRRNRVPPTNL